MPLWLDMLRTPMAAPETATLRRMRRTVLVLCLLSALAVTNLHPLITWLGRGAPFGIGVLLIVSGLYAVLYAIRKHRADEAWVIANTEEQP